jgi:hypothetical protein
VTDKLAAWTRCYTERVYRPDCHEDSYVVSTRDVLIKEEASVVLVSGYLSLLVLSLPLSLSSGYSAAAAVSTPSTNSCILVWF